jgi:hypothetical protein
VFRDLKARGLEAPKLMVADGNAAAWSAASAIWPEAQEQRCWNHKIVNVLDQLPRKLQAMAREQLCAIPYAETRAEAERRRDAFGRAYKRTHPRAVETLTRDWERMVAFYDFPQEHWKHLRTSNVVECHFSGSCPTFLRNHAPGPLRPDWILTRDFPDWPPLTSPVWRSSVEFESFSLRSGFEGGSRRADLGWV